MIWIVIFLETVQKTTQIQAYSLNNLHGPVIVIMNCLVGVSPLKDEIIGFALSILGVFFIIFDPHAERHDG